MIQPMRYLVIPILALLCSPALAQSPPPQPRVTLDIELPAASDFRLYGRGAPGRLAVGGDGTHYVLTNSFRPSSNPLQPALDARIELSAFKANGDIKYRTVLPVQHSLSPMGFEVESLGVAPLPSGAVLVFLGSRNQPVGQALLGEPLTLLYEVDSSGKVVRTSPVAPPTAGEQSGNTYSTRFYVPTADNGLLVGGGYGAGPFAWWIGKFGSDGKRQWQAGAGTGLPEGVYALAVRPNGEIVTVVLQTGTVKDTGRWYIGGWYLNRYAGDGRLLERTRFDQQGDVFAVLANSYVSVVSAYETARRPELVQLGQSVGVVGEAPWAYEKTWFALPHGDGIAAIACYRVSGPPCHVVSAGLDGKVRWQSAPVHTSDIAHTPDGQIASLVWTDDGMRARLVRYAAP